MPLPETKEKQQQVRQCLAFFASPDEDYLMECLDGSDKYEPITAGDYIKQCFARDYWLNRTWSRHVIERSRKSNDLSLYLETASDWWEYYTYIIHEGPLALAAFKFYTFAAKSVNLI